jgi:putative heme degradation protein
MWYNLPNTKTHQFPGLLKKQHQQQLQQLQQLQQQQTQQLQNQLQLQAQQLQQQVNPVILGIFYFNFHFIYISISISISFYFCYLKFFQGQINLKSSHKTFLHISKSITHMTHSRFTSILITFFHCRLQ